MHRLMNHSVVSQRLSFLTLSAALVFPLVMMGCGKKDGPVAAVERTITQSRHDPKTCPNLRDGSYRVQQNDQNQPNNNTALYRTVEVSRNQENQIVLKMDDYQLVANGREQSLTPGSKLSVACVNSSVEVTGTNERGERMRWRLHGTDDGFEIRFEAPNNLNNKYLSANPLRRLLE